MSVKATSNLGALAASLEVSASAVVAKTTLDIQRGAQARSRVDTGDMQAGWTATFAGLRGLVESGTDYTVHNEFGTTKMAAQPMATPAADEARGPYYAAMGRIITGGTFPG